MLRDAPLPISINTWGGPTVEQAFDAYTMPFCAAWSLIAKYFAHLSLM